MWLSLRVSVSMDVGRREQGGLAPPWILKFSVKKVVFLISSGKKQITSLLPRPWKNFGKFPQWHPLEKILPTPMYCVVHAVTSGGVVFRKNDMHWTISSQTSSGRFNNVGSGRVSMLSHHLTSSGGLRLGGPEARRKRGPSGDVIILSQPWNGLLIKPRKEICGPRCYALLCAAFGVMARGWAWG